MFVLRTVFWKLREILPAWGPVRWTVTAAALCVLFLTGVSLFHTPAYEVIYSSRWIAMPVDKGRTTVFCTLEVGNTGRKPQEDVRIHFTKAAVDHAVVRPTARNFGVTDRALRISTSGTRTTIALGRLDPEKRVTVSLLLSYADFEPPPPWAAAFKGIDPARGKVKIGDPGLTAAGRGIFTAFFDFLPF